MSRRSAERLVLGVDPGLSATGYGIVVYQGGKMRVLASGVIRPGSRRSVGRRLFEIHQQMSEILDQYEPDVVALEDVFYAKNVRTAIALGQARGVVLLLAASRDLPVDEFPPATIKQTVVGTGRAEKHQVQKMVQVLLGMPEPPGSEHAADALATAICQIHHAGPGGP